MSIKYLLIITFCFFLCETAAQTIETDTNVDTIPEGSIRGLFSISPTQKVYFSRGNLQFCRTKGTHMAVDGREQKGTWRFAPNQYDYIGIGKNHDALLSKDGFFDSFGWATSGYDNTKRDSAATNFQPWSPCVYEVKKTKDIPGRKAKSDDETTTLYHSEGFGPTYNKNRNNNITGKNKYYDWGLYNAISNGGNAPGMWRLLSAEEVIYLFLKRQNAIKLLSFGVVNGQNGVIVLPDNWHTPEGCQFVSFADSKCKISENTFGGQIRQNKMIYASDSGIDLFQINNFSAEQWSVMESHGAVFLHYNGMWTSSSISTKDAISSGIVFLTESGSHCYFDALNIGCKTYKKLVRLVSVYEYNVERKKK